MIIMNCSEKIKKYRTELGITQKELARRAHIATVSVQQYEAGVRNPKIETLCKIASGLDVPVNAIRSDSDLEFEAFKKSAESVTDERRLEIEEKRLSNLIDRKKKMLNISGKQRAADYMDDLTKIPEYRKDKE